MVHHPLGREGGGGHKLHLELGETISLSACAPLLSPQHMVHDIYLVPPVALHGPLGGTMLPGADPG